MSIVELQQQENKGNGANNACVLPQLRGREILPVQNPENRV